MNAVEVREGTSPLILAFPHASTDMPQNIAARLNRTGHRLTDTDWHVDRLYEGLIEEASVIRATFHRYIIDANRDPGGASLYPGANTTGLCPLTDFDGQPIWREGNAPGADDLAARRRLFHGPYHLALQAQIERVQARHGIAILHDCHSIRSHIPYLFEGELPVLNIGTDGGTSCAAAIEAAVMRIAEGSPFSHVLNGRFRGGWTTRHYGRPAGGIHALQMEIAQRAYVVEEAPPWRFDPAKADKLRTTLKAMIDALLTTISKEARP